MDLKVINVSKSYSGRQVLHSTDIELSKGSVIGLLGLNGAGKSTLLKGLAAIQPFDSGDVICDGYSLRSHPRQYCSIVGYQPEQPVISSTLTVQEQLTFTGKIRGINSKNLKQRIDDLLTILNLDHLRYAACSELSKGEAQRVSFALATIHNPALLLLDEPTSGLDPKQLAYFRNVLLFERSSRVVILSTHHLHEVETFCDKIYMLKGGKLEEIDRNDQYSSRRLEQHFIKAVNS